MIKIGAAFCISNNCIQIGEGYIKSSESFYLKPTGHVVNTGMAFAIFTINYPKRRILLVSGTKI